MRHWAVELAHGGGWDALRGIREQDGWDERAAFMDALVADGFIVVGGPVGDGSTTLHLVVAEDEPSIRSRLATDPWALDRHLVVHSVRPWALWLDGRTSSVV